jgi:adenylate cyclase
VSDTGIQRRLAAILAADVVGYSKMMGEDETGAIRAVQKLRGEIIEPKIAAHNGRLFKTMGDGFLVEFVSVVNAVQCAVDIQGALSAPDALSPDGGAIRTRIGINVGDVVVADGDLLGDGVNVAARLEGAAPPGGILISGSAREQIGNRLDLAFDDLGELSLKNINRPLRAFLVRSGGDEGRMSSVIVQDKPSIALLPFVSLSKDPEQEALADGITENVIMGLSRFRDLSVIASNSSFALKGRAIKIQDASRELGARYILQGNVQKARDRVRITAQLVDGHTGRNLWSDRYDRSMDDLFAVQDEVTEQIVGSLATAYGGRLIRAWHDRPEHTGTRNHQALDHFIRGMDALNKFTNADNSVARDLFTRAGELDPRFGKAFAKLAWTFLTEANEGWSADPNTSLEQAHKAALLAIERDDAEAWGHYALAGYFLYRRQFDKSIAQFRRALDLNPNDPDVLTDFGYALSYAGESKEALETCLKGRRLNPFYPEWYIPPLGQIYYDAGRYPEAVETLESLRNIDTVYSRMYLVASHMALGNGDEARRSISRAIEIDPNATISKVTSPEMAPYRNESDLQKFKEHLRQAGLPE